MLSRSAWRADGGRIRVVELECGVRYLSSNARYLTFLTFGSRLSPGFVSYHFRRAQASRQAASERSPSTVMGPVARDVDGVAGEGRLGGGGAGCEQHGRGQCRDSAETHGSPGFRRRTPGKVHWGGR